VSAQESDPADPVPQDLRTLCPREPGPARRNLGCLEACGSRAAVAPHAPFPGALWGKKKAGVKQSWGAQHLMRTRVLAAPACAGWGPCFVADADPQLPTQDRGTAVPGRVMFWNITRRPPSTMMGGSTQVAKLGEGEEKVDWPNFSPHGLVTPH
jgi:hypothetical protein